MSKKRPPHNPGRRDKIKYMRWSKDELATVEEAARQEGMSYSSFVRHWVLKVARVILRKGEHDLHGERG